MCSPGYSGGHVNHIGHVVLRTIGVVTGGRADYGIYRPLLRAIQKDPGLKLCVIATGMHLSPEFGLTAGAIEDDGFNVDERVESLLSSDTPEGIAKSMGLGTVGFAQLFGHRLPDILVVLGDRFEMHAAAVAALPFKIPIAHIHGGEITEGAIDDALRHSMTKLSHLHFVAAKTYADRLIQMGEEPWRVTVAGALSLDNIQSMRLLGRDELEDKLGMSLENAPLMITFHPVTLEYEKTEWQVSQLLHALESVNGPVVFSIPNADTNGRIIVERFRAFVKDRPNACLVENLGTDAYFSLMKIAAAMAGNSSSGIIEAASFQLPVVNIGNRQSGRIRARNVIDTGYHSEEILTGIQKALSAEFRLELAGLANPYGNDHAAEKILGVLRDVELGEKLIRKRFSEVPSLESSVLRSLKSGL